MKRQTRSGPLFLEHADALNVGGIGATFDDLDDTMICTASAVGLQACRCWCLRKAGQSSRNTKRIWAADLLQGFTPDVPHVKFRSKMGNSCHINMQSILHVNLPSHSLTCSRLCDGVGILEKSMILMFFKCDAILIRSIGLPVACAEDLAGEGGREVGTLSGAAAWDPGARGLLDLVLAVAPMAAVAASCTACGFLLSLGAPAGGMPTGSYNKRL